MEGVRRNIHGVTASIILLGLFMEAHAFASKPNGSYSLTDWSRLLMETRAFATRPNDSSTFPKWRRLLMEAHAVATKPNDSYSLTKWHRRQVPVVVKQSHVLNVNDRQMLDVSRRPLQRLDHEQRFQTWLDYIHRTSHSPFEIEKLEDDAQDNRPRVQNQTTAEYGGDLNDPFAVLDNADDNEDVNDLFAESHNTDLQTNSTERNKFKTAMKIKVAKDGSGDVTSVQEAVDRVPKHFNKRVLIYIKGGIYREKVRIHRNKPYITFKGDRKKQTIITYDSTASDVSGRKRPMRTYGSATVAVNSNFFIAHDITFRNTAPRPAPGAIGQQAVALRISADMAAFYRCKFHGNQDTLYDHHGRHYFKNCYVEGTVDFIFGNGRSLYKNCHLHALNNSGQVGSLTAQKRNETTTDTGFSFVDSAISGSGQVFLGRAWGNDSRVVFAKSHMDDVVFPGGWNDWGIQNRETTVYYAEYRCTGPGAAGQTQRVPWSRVLSPHEAKPFLTSAFVNGKRWLAHL